MVSIVNGRHQPGIPPEDKGCVSSEWAWHEAHPRRNAPWALWPVKPMGSLGFLEVENSSDRWENGTNP